MSGTCTCGHEELRHSRGMGQCLVRDCDCPLYDEVDEDYEEFWDDEDLEQEDY